MHEEIIERRRQGYPMEADPSSDASSRSGISSSSEPGSGKTASDDGPPVNDAEHAETSARAAIEKQVDLLKKMERDAQDAETRRRFVGSKQWLYSHLASPIDPSLQNFLRRWFKENELYDILTFVVTLGQGGLHISPCPEP